MAMQSHLRQINRRKVIEAMLRLRTASRGDIASVSGLSQPTVGRIAEELLREHFLAELTPSTSPAGLAPGRPTQFLELDRERRRFLAIELGVEQTNLATLPVGVAMTDTWDQQFPTPSSLEAWTRALGKAAGDAADTKLHAVILSIPGVVDEQQGRGILCPNIRWAEQADFPASLAHLTPAPLIVIQEIRALALGQLLSEPKLTDFLLVDIGSGVGAAAVVNGQLYRGPLALSGELGHIPVPGNIRRCGCGAIGCVETLASRTGLLASAREHHVARTWPELVHHVHTKGLQPWLRSALDALATAIISGTNILGLRDVLLTGVLEELPPEAVEYLSQAVCRGSMWGRFGEVRCRATTRRRTAGMVLAAIERLSEVDGL